jgi:hypothetical protein
MLVGSGQTFGEIIEALVPVTHFIQHAGRRCQLGIPDFLLLRPQCRTIRCAIRAAIEQFADRLHLLQQFIRPVCQCTRVTTAYQLKLGITPAMRCTQFIFIDCFAFVVTDSRAFM